MKKILLTAILTVFLLGGLLLQSPAQLGASVPDPAFVLTFGRDGVICSLGAYGLGDNATIVSTGAGKYIFMCHGTWLAEAPTEATQVDLACLNIDDFSRFPGTVEVTPSGEFNARCILTAS